MTTTKTSKKVDFGIVVSGDVFSETQYYTVIKKVGDKIQLQNDKGENIVVNKDYVENQLISATQFTEEKTVNKTDLANIVINNPNTAMTVNFNKQVKESDLIKEVMDAYEGSTIKTMETAVKKAIKRGLTGEERTIKGRHFGEISELGRLQFVDMEIVRDITKDYDTRLRQIDPRTINYVILKGTKYSIK